MRVHVIAVGGSCVERVCASGVSELAEITTANMVEHIGRLAIEIQTLGAMMRGLARPSKD